jgi:hypothetical protein
MIPEIDFEVAPRNGKPTRVVIARYGEDGEHRSVLNTDSAVSRERFFRQLGRKIDVDLADLVTELDKKLMDLGDDADRSAEAELASSDEEEAESADRKSQATTLVELVAAASAELFHDPDKVAYAKFAVSDHVEVARVNSGAFKRWLAKLYYEKTGKAPNSQAKADAAGVLEGKAVFDGPEYRVYVRVAEHQGRYFLDLCNEKWQAVEIDAGGWRIIDNPPVIFRRAKAMLPLPIPLPGGKL